MADKGTGESGAAPQESPTSAKVVADQAPSPFVSSIWATIKHHKVVEWTLAYTAFGYATLHGVVMLRETFDWPALVPRLVTYALLLGIPVAGTVAWYHGHRARHRVSGPELSILIALLVVAGSVLWWVSRNSRERVEAPAAKSVANVSPSAASFNPPPHSIAVLPFVNMSSDKEQEYFSEGLTEELLNSLSRISELQVAARTSSFSFQGEHPDIAIVAHRLNVGAVLEGSVRRSANTVRVTAQLVNTVTGFHLWSETYDRDLGDVLKLQTEIATAVASALKVTLLGDAAAKIEVGGTRNPAAFDAYLRGWQAFYVTRDFQRAIDLHSQAIEMDPNYALAFAGRSTAFANHAFALVEHANAGTLTTSLAARDSALGRALEDAHKAIALAPTMGEGYSALGLASVDALEFRRADAAMERALALAPGNARVLRLYGFVTVPLGRVDSAIAAGRQALLLDPLNAESVYNLSGAFFYARRYKEALAVLQRGGADPPWGEVNTNRGTIYYLLRDYEGARASCELDTSDLLNLTCLAITYHAIARHSDADAVFKRMQSKFGDAAMYQYARIHAQWGDGAKALDCLDSALRLRDADLSYLKMDPLLDPIRKEPRFQAIERALKFPD